MIRLMHEYPWVFAIGSVLLLTVAFVVATLYGVRVGRPRPGDGMDKESPAGVSAVEGTVFAVLGLLLAFTFSGAAERFQIRRAQILQETQAVGSAWNCLGVLPDAARDDLRARFRQYLDRRLAAYRESTPDSLQSELQAIEKLGREVADAAVAAVRTPEGQQMAEVVLPPINEMLEVALARRVALTNHPPRTVFGLLLVLSLGAAFLVGLAMGTGPRRRWTYILGFALVLSLTLYVTLDLDMPRLGLLRIDRSDGLLDQLRRTMG